ncbi:hypothetical protein PoB_000388800 [Plakobranchus ocellatus]|uniref:Uncharacterized protein n=1 Tax=Plakobranchus ocellatus TaxID=259542 RepID=A0AAV3Y4P5_9GAST|nr:hypothetical protein PoB_000388800 [Plakobranchus ocellatus]
MVLPTYAMKGLFCVVIHYPFFLKQAGPQQGDLSLSGPPSGQASGRRWRGSNPRQKGPCRSQGECIVHYATDAPALNCSNSSLSQTYQKKDR